MRREYRRNVFPQGKKKSEKAVQVGWGDSKCVNFVTNIKIMKSENGSGGDKGGGRLQSTKR